MSSNWFKNEGDEGDSGINHGDLERKEEAQINPEPLPAKPPQEISKGKIDQEITPVKSGEIKPSNDEILIQLLKDIEKNQHILKVIQYLAKNEMKPTSKLRDVAEGENFAVGKNYTRDSRGELEYINKKLMKNQRKVIGYVLKQLGQFLLSGKSLLTIALPVNIYEPRTILERLGAAFGYAPHFLEKGGESEDALEQMKNTIAFMIACLHLQTNQEKPFDSIIGETFQGYLGDCEVYMEQVLYEPQITCAQVYGKKFVLNGSFEYLIDTYANSVKGRCLRIPKVTYKNTNNEVAYHAPYVIIGGTAIGKRTFNYHGKGYVYDLKNSLYCEIHFDDQREEWFSKKSIKKDHFSGIIWKITDKFVEKINDSVAKHKEIKLTIKEKEDIIKPLCKVEGNWLERLEIDGKTYWKVEDYKPYQIQYAEKPLPSDSCYRPDIINWKLGNESNSQDLKLKLEEAQRRDAKLRQEGEQKLAKAKVKA